METLGSFRPVDNSNDAIVRAGLAGYLERWPGRVRAEQRRALILVLSLSFGLWAAIWGAVVLLAMCGRQ